MYGFYKAKYFNEKEKIKVLPNTKKDKLCLLSPIPTPPIFN
jgi:hypothetical protein